jgi:hypothetical protein
MSQGMRRYQYECELYYSVEVTTPQESTDRCEVHTYAVLRLHQRDLTDCIVNSSRVTGLK